MKHNETTQKFIGADIGGSITHENVGQKTNKTRKHIWRFPKYVGDEITLPGDHYMMEV